MADCRFCKQSRAAVAQTLQDVRAAAKKLQAQLRATTKNQTKPPPAP